MSALAWAPSTRRAMRWQPLLLSAGTIAGVAFALWLASAPPMAEPPEMIAVTVLIAGATLALDDPAHALVAAAPIGFGRRLAHRLAWLGPATLGLLFGIGWLADRLTVAPLPDQVFARAATLGSAAVATHVLVSRRRPDLAASTATIAPVGLVVFGLSTPRATWGGGIAHLWIDQPWAVVGCAAAIVAISARRH